MNRSRTGAALIIAIVVLAAMLLLGLPFLFTQSGSMSGTRSYAHARLASMGQDSAQSMGIAAGASAVSYRWQRDGVSDGSALFVDDWSDLFLDLGGTMSGSGLRRIGVNRVEFDTRSHTFALPGTGYFDSLPAAERDVQRQRYPTVVGLAIEDESGKLDPNHLNIRAWTRLLQAVGIADWTDGRAPVDDEGRKQLARALSVLRYQLPGGRITNLEQLLQAEPPATYGSADTPMPKPRRGLTRLELERLRPYLTVHSLAQARGGMIDLGTVIGVAGAQVTLDHDEPQAVLAHPTVPQLVGIGTTLIASDPDDAAVPPHQQAFALPAIGETARRPRTGAALAIDAPPAVNIHQAEEPVRRAFAPNPLPPAAPPASPGQPPRPSLLNDLSTLGSLGNDSLGRPRTAFDLLAPLAVIDERGTTHVLASRQGDPVVSGAYDMSGMLVDPATNAPLLQDRTSLIRVVTGSLDLFPTRGFAAIFLSNNRNDREIIEYRRSEPDLPLSHDAVADLTEVALRDVRRGLNGTTGLANGTARTWPSGTDRSRYDRPADLHLVALVPHEQHPVGIASTGVITIASTATVTDAAGNQTAQDQHRVVAQALPQEQQLEARFDKQATLHALIAQRHGSLLTTFPQPYPRIGDILPQDGANVDGSGARVQPYADPADPERSVGVRPATMRTLLTHSHLDHSWRLPFAGNSKPDADPPALKTSTGHRPAIDGYTAADLTPEGLRLDRNRVLAYPNPSNGLLRDSYVPRSPTDPNSGGLAPIHGRQFSLWVRPDTTWTSEVSLLDMRIPIGNVSARLTGDLLPNQARDMHDSHPSDAAISNRFTLAYDPAVEQLVLVLNPGSIPHVADYGPAIPRQTYGPTAGISIKNDVWPAVNPECLGSGGVHPMACAPPEVAIQHRYFVGDRFVPGEWHLVQVTFSSNQPGGMSIIVDGLAGRDVTRTPTDPTAMTVPGDHFTQPTLVLATDLPTLDQVRDIGTTALYVERITLNAIAYDTVKLTGAAAVRRLLPERGLVRIGNEYISYQWIDDDGALRDCVRGRRQRTDGGVNSEGEPNWGSSHVMEPHRIGDVVYPGGFAFKVPNNVQWWRGGCHLAQPMPDGDPLHKYQVWANIGVPELEATSGAIPLGGSPVIDQFPPRGYVRIRDDQLYYENRGVRPVDTTPPTLLNVHYWGTETLTNPDGTTTTRDGWIAGLPREYIATDEVVLISQEIAGKNLAGADLDPTAPGRYAQSGPSMFVQLYDARPAGAGRNAGRIEWISYTEIRSRTDYPLTSGTRVSYLINQSLETVAIVPDPDPMQPPVHQKELRGGFWFADGRTAPFIRFGARARERTGFAAADFSDYDRAAHTFPALTTRVIPVQTNLEIAYLLEAGDVVTLAPQFMDAAQRPIQLCVRYSADDGFPENRGTPTATSWNSMNRHFAFSEAIPDEWNPGGAFHLLSWPCWTPEDDLSDIDTGSQWRQHRLGWVLPWANAFAPDFAATATNRTLSFLTTGNGASGAVATIDAVHAGGINGWSEDNSRNPQPTELVQANILPPNGDVWLDAVPLSQPVSIRADSGIFAWPYGLVDIGGEVFAYRRNTAPIDHGSAHAYLIGRGLLGSSQLRHQGRELILHLPMGPVAEIVDGLARDRTGPVRFSGYFSAPALLLTSRNGDVMELTTMPNSHTAPWLRGMYNTTPVDWAARGSDPEVPNLAPLAIGWWPRYPSVYPNGFGPASDHFSEYMRCRSYAWAGYPLRFHDSRFTGTDAVSVQPLSHGNGLFHTHITALDGTLDWSAAQWVALLSGTAGTVPAQPITSAGVAFQSDRFITGDDEVINPRLTTPGATPRAVDGAEVRIAWTYVDQRLPSSMTPADWLQAAARNGNRAPMIGPVYVRARAPNQVLSVER
jgi:hypothetical protein